MSYCNVCHVVDAGARPDMQHRRCGGSAHASSRPKHKNLPSTDRGEWVAGDKEGIECATCNPPEVEDAAAS